MAIIRLLGPPSIEVGGCIVSSFRSSRIPALLGLLASKLSAWQREDVAAALWPDHGPTEGRHNLRQTMQYVKQIDENLIRADRNSIELDGDVDCDVHRLFAFQDELVAHEDQIESAKAAIAVYRGEFLPGLDDEWIESFRSQCAAAFMEALLLLANEAMAKNPKRALELADRAIQMDPFMDGARAKKIQALVSLGEVTSAHREFTTYRQFLLNELGIEPSVLVADALHFGIAKTPEATEKVEEVIADEEANVRFLLDGFRPVGGLDLAVSHVPLWISQHRTGDGIRILGLALEANCETPQHQSCLVGKVAMGELLFASGRSFDAKELLTQVLLQLPVSSVRIRCLIILSRVLSSSYRGRQAQAYVEELLSLVSEKGSDEVQVDAYSCASEIYFQLEQLDDSLRYSEACMAIARRIGDWRAFANKTGLVAYMHQRSGKVDEAKEAVATGLAGLEGKDSQSASFIRVRFFRLLEEIGDPVGAEVGYRKGIDEARSYGDKTGLAVCLTYLGDLLTVKDEYDEAMECHQEALGMRQEMKDRLGEATSLRGIGRIKLALEEYDEANKSLRLSAQYYLDCDALVGHASSMFELARVAHAANENQLALRLALRTKQLFSGMSPFMLSTIGPIGRSTIEVLDRLLAELQANL